MVSYSVIHSFPTREIEVAWRQFIKKTELPSHYVTPEYFHEPYVRGHHYFADGTQPYAVLAEAGGGVTGILTGRRSNRDLISGQPHRPQLVLAAGDDRLAAEEALVHGSIQEGKECRLITVYSWTPLKAFSTAGFTTTKARNVFLLNLSRSEDELFRGFSATKRNCIRQAERKGIEITSTYNDTDIEDLLEAFAETHGRHGLAPRSRADLEQLLKLERNRKLFIARAEGRVIAGTIIRFELSGLAEYSENVSLKWARRYYPNEALLWRAIQWSRTQGCQAFSFGGSSLFVAGFGGELVPVYRIRRDQTFLHRIDFSESAFEVVKRGVRLMRSALRKITGGAKKLGRQRVAPKLTHVANRPQNAKDENSQAQGCCAWSRMSKPGNRGSALLGAAHLH